MTSQERRETIKNTVTPYQQRLQNKIIDVINEIRKNELATSFEKTNFDERVEFRLTKGLSSKIKFLQRYSDYDCGDSIVEIPSQSDILRIAVNQLFRRECEKHGISI